MTCLVACVFFFLNQMTINFFSPTPIFTLGTRRQHEEELKLLEEETARRLEEAIRKNVDEELSSEEVKLEIERRVAEGVKKLFDDVEAQLEKEKQDALAEARRKEVSILTGTLFFLSFPLFLWTKNHGQAIYHSPSKLHYYIGEVFKSLLL